MTKGQLHEEYRHPTNDEHREVRDEESTAAVLVTQIRETPKIPQSDGKRFNQDLLLRSITTCVHTTLAGNRSVGQLVFPARWFKILRTYFFLVLWSEILRGNAPALPKILLTRQRRKCK